MRLTIPTLALALLPSLAFAAPTTYKLNASASTVQYKVTHPSHNVDAKATKLEGVAVIKPDSTLFQLRVDNRAFDSGNANRDDHQRQTIEADKFPYTNIKGKVTGFTMPSSFPSDVKCTLVGEMEFHGVKNPVSIPLTVSFDSATHAVAKATFDFSLDSYKVDRPSLLFVKLNDNCHIDATLDFTGT